MTTLAVVPRRTISPFRLTSLLRLERDPTAALQLFRNPNPTCPKPFRRSARSYDVLICKLGAARMFREMEQIIDQMLQETDRYTPREALFRRVMTFYGRAHQPAAAVRVYLRIPLFGCRRTTRSFNALLTALLNCGDLERIEEMCRGFDLAPDVCTYNVLINACCSMGNFSRAWELFNEIPIRGLQPSVVTFGTLISNLCSHSRLDEAFRLKKEMWDVYKLKPHIYIYTSLMKGLCDNGELDSVFKLKEEMQSDSELRWDSAVYSTLIRALFKAGRKQDVVGLLEEMRHYGLAPGTVTYNAMIAGFCESKEFDAAFEVLDEMERKRCKPDVVSYNVIIGGLCREGMLKDASELLEDMPRRGCTPDVISYRTLIGGLCDAGQIKDAAVLLEEMVFKGFTPHPTHARRVLEWLSGNGVDDSLIDIIHSLSKVNGFDSCIWEVAVCFACKAYDKERINQYADVIIH